MGTVIRRTDIQTMIVPFIARTANSLVAGSGGRLDVVSQLAKVVPARLIGCFGCQPSSDPELTQWASTIFQCLFADQKPRSGSGQLRADGGKETPCMARRDHCASEDPSRLNGRCFKPLSCLAGGGPGCNGRCLDPEQPYRFAGGCDSDDLEVLPSRPR